jgi:hypothetical protein
MTEAQARKIKDPRLIPWNEPCFVYVAGRYYLGMWFVGIPKNKECPQGGNLTLQCWRFNSSPEDWVLTFRFRYYTGHDPWDGQDRKSWYAAKMSGPEDTIVKGMADFVSYVPGLAGLYCLCHPPLGHSLIFKGNSEKALAIIEKEKPFWMHLKISP